MDIFLSSFAGHSSLGHFLLSTVFNACAIFLAAYLLKGVYIQNFTRALILALLLALLNATIGEILSFITQPVNWVTFGLFNLVVDAIVLMLAEYFVRGFKIVNFSWAILFAMVLAIFNSILRFVYM